MTTHQFGTARLPKSTSPSEPGPHRPHGPALWSTLCDCSCAGLSRKSLLPFYSTRPFPYQIPLALRRVELPRIPTQPPSRVESAAVQNNAGLLRPAAVGLQGGLRGPQAECTEVCPSSRCLVMFSARTQPAPAAYVDCLLCAFCPAVTVTQGHHVPLFLMLVRPRWRFSA